MKKLLYTLIAIAFAILNMQASAQIKRMSNTARFNLASQQGQLQGTISLSENIVQPLQQGWNASVAQAVGNKIKVELWQVNYAVDQNDHNYTDVFLVQRLDANVSYNLAPTGIQYTASYRPVAGNVVAIAYTDVAPNASIKFAGKPDDGVQASMAHQFKSDAKKYLGNNIIYGIYSVSQQGGNIVNADFRVLSTIRGNCKNCFGIDDVWNTVSDIADAVTKFVTASIDGTADAIKELGENIVVNNGVFFVQCFGTIATFLQTGNLPKARLMRDYGNAYNIANSTIFMGTLPPIDKIIVTNLMSIDRRQFTVPVKNGNDVYILMNMGAGFDDPTNYNGNGFPGDVFIHELTHAWQIWHDETLMLFVDGAVNQFKNTVIGNQYLYMCDGHNINDTYNEEQQAMIVQYFYDTMFFRQKGIFTNKGAPVTCGFEQQWVVQHILNNNPSASDQFSATMQIILSSYDRAIAGYTGGVIDHTIAFPSNGNRTDGTGYFLPGKNNNSFFYYSNKTKVTAANWGPIRDKFIKENYEFGELGWPERSEALLPDAIGYYQKFNHGFIYYHPKYGTYTILNKIFDGFKTVGWETGKLGYPISDYVSERAPEKGNNKFTEYLDKGYQKFVGGVIFYALPSFREAVAPGNQNYCTIEYGDPNRLVELHLNARTSVGPGTKISINPQPLPPKSATTSVNPATRVQINPQPLPPIVLKHN